MQPPGIFRHNLYVCSVDTPNLHDHLVLRDMLRARPDLRDRYAATKYEMAERFPDDIDSYIDGKGPVIVEAMTAGRAAATFQDFQPEDAWLSRSEHHGNQG